jgi:hypothetical protein
VPCDEIVLSLQAYRLAFGLPPVPAPDETLPLLLSVRRTRWGKLKGLGSRTAVWKVVTGLCDETLAYAPRPPVPRRRRPVRRRLHPLAAAHLREGTRGRR